MLESINVYGCLCQQKIDNKKMNNKKLRVGLALITATTSLGAYYWSFPDAKHEKFPNTPTEFNVEPELPNTSFSDKTTQDSSYDKGVLTTFITTEDRMYINRRLCMAGKLIKIYFVGNQVTITKHGEELINYMPNPCVDDNYLDIKEAATVFLYQPKRDLDDGMYTIVDDQIPFEY